VKPVLKRGIEPMATSCRSVVPRSIRSRRVAGVLRYTGFGHPHTQHGIEARRHDAAQQELAPDEGAGHVQVLAMISVVMMAGLRK
jgi:hypothetical protein